MNAQRRIRTAARWGAGLTLALGVHAAGAMVLLTRWPASEQALAGGPVIMVEFAPVAAAPAAVPTEVAPGPSQPDAQAEPAPPTPPVEAEPAPEPKKQVEEPARAAPVPAPEPQKEIAEPVPVEPEPAPQPVLTVLPPPKPAIKPQPKSEPRQKQASLASAPSATERKAARAVAPAPGATRHDPNALPNWKSQLVARLERYKRYPPAARARGEHGVTQLAFSVDRAGHVHRARILRSSGSTLLDRATLALIARAQPLPPPPPQIRGGQIAIVVPIRYRAR